MPSHKCIVPSFRADRHSCKMSSHEKKCSVASGWSHCKCSKTPNSLNKNSKLSKTKGIKMTQKRYREVINGWKKQNAELEAEKAKFKCDKESNKKTLALKCDEIFALKAQNSRLEELLMKCEDQITKLEAAENARNANKIMANNLDTQLFSYQAHLKDLEIKLKSICDDIYNAKAERNKLMIETFNLRKDNKNLEAQIKDTKGVKEETDCEFNRLQFLLNDMRKHDNDGPYFDYEDDDAIDDIFDIEEIKLHEAPSAMTAFNNLKSNHETEMKKVKFEIDQMKNKVENDQKEIAKLQKTIKSLT